MNDLESRSIVEQFYRALSKGDMSALMALNHDDVIFDIIGSTPVSGRFHGKDACFGQVFPPVVEALVPGAVNLAREWDVVCADEQCAVGFNRGGGPTTKSGLYDQIYAMAFVVQDGRIAHLYGFFDTAHVEEVIFDNPLTQPRKPPPIAFQLPGRATFESHLDEVRDVVNRYYDALARGDMAAYFDLHDENVVFNINGTTPVSGRFSSRSACFEKVVEPFLGAFIAEESRFGDNWKLFAIDSRRAFAVMQGGGPTIQGIHADVIFAQLFTVQNGRIVELHELLDTAHIEAAVFGNTTMRPENTPEHPFEL